MPNHYLFLVKAKSVLENRDVNCVEFVKLSTDCFVKHLEKVLQCQLPWDGSRNESIVKTIIKNLNYFNLFRLSKMPISLCLQWDRILELYQYRC